MSNQHMIIELTGISSDIRISDEQAKALLNKNIIRVCGCGCEQQEDAGTIVYHANDDEDYFRIEENIDAVIGATV